MPRQLLVRRLTRPGEWPRLRSAAAAATSLSALAATSLVAAPAATADTGPGPCRLTRTAAHHSEGVSSWNGAYPRPRRTLDAVMVFLSFPDSGPLLTPRTLAADHFPSTTDFFERASYGKFRLRAHPRSSWIRMPRPSTDYEVRRDWKSDRRGAYLRDALAVSDPHVDFAKYDIVYFVADPDAPGVDSDATKVVNFEKPMRADGTDLRRIVTVFERHPPDRNVLAHETGHVFDLPDLYHRPSDGKGDWDTFVGDWDLMGSQFGLAPDFFAWHKWRFGWLKDPQVVCVQGGQDVTLEAVSKSPVDRRSRMRRDPATELASGASARAATGVGTGASTEARTSAGVSAPAGAGGQVLGAGVRVAARSDGAPPAPGGAHPSAPHGGSPAYAPPPSPPLRSMLRGNTVGPVRAPALGRRAPVAAPAPGKKLAVIRTGRDSVLAVEARSRVGNDRTTCTEGVLLYEVRGEAASGEGPVEVVDTHPDTEACWGDSVYPPLADAPLRTGESFRVPGERVRISVHGRTAEGDWKVRIRPE
ncbi:M6 family metalloprotease domain-containing protein [Streptomyces sp. NA04227]|uniref:M6 family metalloprotease domain-containing protein n=1 Tax=Streptomyces sp. NA04227 TaxID=2742136 RepID=UPI0020CA738E|nr:M6 family metalloprotease domain-containing protein [Streptomyces sp. NA04227]